MVAIEIHKAGIKSLFNYTHEDCTLFGDCLH